MEKGTNYWLHRITGGDNASGVARNLLRNGYMSIGWCDFSDEESLKRIRTDYDSFNNMFLDAWDILPRNRWNLWRFVNEMRHNDIVVIPTPYYFSVYKILDDRVYTVQSLDRSLLKDWNGENVVLKEDGYLYNSNNDIVDLGFFRKVEPIEVDIPRDGFADQYLTSRMKIRQTNAYINDIKESVLNGINNFREDRPINLRKAVLDEAQELVLSKIHTLQNDAKFEDLVKWYLESIGGKVETPPKNESPTKDGDADKVAFFDKLGVAIMVQAKKHFGETDKWAVDQINAYKRNHNFEDYTTILWVISTCDTFSEEAIQTAATNGVKLINGRDFARMILDAGLDGLNL